jgi:chaperonin GroES
LPIVGCEFKKTYFDKTMKKNASLRVSAENLIINYKAKSLERAPRLTEEIEYYPLEIEAMERLGVFRPISYTASPNSDNDDDAPVKFFEQHRWYDFDDDGVREPYIVTVEKQSQQVVRVVARYDMDGVQYNFTEGKLQRIEPIHYYTKYDFLPNPEGGIYGVGFGQLLKPINESINTTLNMLIDAGHLANVQGGFIGKGLSMNAGKLRFEPGEWKPVNAAGAVVRDSLVPLKFDGPSPVLFQLLGLLIEAAKEISGVKDVLTGQPLPANTPATTMLAMIEQGLKTYTAIFKRVHRAFKQELAKLYRLNRIYLDQEASYKVGNTWKSITRADYEKGSGVEPVSDPTIVTDMQRLGQAQFLADFQENPLMQPVEIIKRRLKAANIPNIDNLFNPNPPPNPAIVKASAELVLKKQELDVKQAHEAASIQLRERHDVALIASEEAKALNYRATALNQVAQAEKAMGAEKLGWAEHALDVVRMQIDALAQGQVDSTAAATDAFANPPASAAPPSGGVQQ